MDTTWVEVRTCLTLHEAEVLRSVLDGVGIASVIPDEYAIGVQPFFATMAGGIRVLVPAEDVERAAEVLDSVVEPATDPGDDPGPQAV